MGNLFTKYRLTISNSKLNKPVEISEITTKGITIKYVTSKALMEQKRKMKYNSKVNPKEGKWNIGGKWIRKNLDKKQNKTKQNVRTNASISVIKVNKLKFTI